MKFKPAYQGLREDPESNVYPRQAPGIHYSNVIPEKVPEPKLICWSDQLAKAMGLKQSKEMISALSGNNLIDGMKPVATRYGGHQFGHWAGQLGDGRAITLGLLEGNGFDFEVQLKGAGLTPYSRTADGKAVFRSSLREYICSEAMANLNVPTTRALSLLKTGEVVIRDMFYDGNPAPEDGAICSRVAPSFLRFGHFQIHASLNEKEELKELIKFTIDNFYPGKSIQEFFLDVVNKTAFLITEWYRVGFVHGVMNTDNMSILGLTIDYGPYGWLDPFDPDWTPNTTDFSQRRYRFMHQHNIAYWNLARLAEALEVVGPSLEKELDRFPDIFKHHFSEMMTKKLGLDKYQDELVNKTFHLLTDLQGDMTLFYRSLIHSLEGQTIEWQDVFYKDLNNKDRKKVADWITEWNFHLSSDAKDIMKKVNPVFIPRNYIVQEALDDLEKSDEETLRRIERALKNPYEENEATLFWFKKRPDWAAERPGCSTLSCSS
jgi:uncharacterized protein YdiU (UPF0061 family)